MTTEQTAHATGVSPDSSQALQLLVRNRVADYARWRACFDEDLDPAADYGLSLAALWQDAGDPDNVFFLFDVRSRAEAEAFMARPESQDMGLRAGVLDGEFSFLRQAAQMAPPP